MKRKSKLAEATISEQAGVRHLHLGTPWIQGAMRIRQPHKLELDYIQRMMAWMLLREPAELAHSRCLQLGLGAAAITKYCHSVLRLPTTVVEINPHVVQACKIWFHLPENDERLTVIEADAAKFVQQDEHIAAFDALCVDLYDHDAASPVLDDEVFYRACWRLLDEGGVMSVNLFGREASFDRSAQRIGAAFGADRVAMLKPTTEGNTIVLAWKGFDLPAREVLAERAESLQTTWSLPARKWLKLLGVIKPAVLEPEGDAAPAAQRKKSTQPKTSSTPKPP